jgi:uncharacterized membrane protein
VEVSLSSHCIHKICIWQFNYSIVFRLKCATIMKIKQIVNIFKHNAVNKDRRFLSVLSGIDAWELWVG